MRKRRQMHRAAIAALVVGTIVAPLLAAGASPVLATVPPPLPPLPPEPHDLQRHLAQQIFYLAQMQRAKLDAQASSIADLAPEDFRIKVVLAATRWGLDPRLVASIITVESHWNPKELGTHGDAGLMQIIPPTGAEIAQQLKIDSYDLFDIDTNLNFGCYYLHLLQDAYKQPLLMLAAYNGGPVAVAAAKASGTNVYAERVLQLYRHE